MIDFSQHISISENVMYREVDGNLVFLNMDNEQYYGLNESGTRVWQVLTSSGTIQMAYDALLKEYEVEPDRLEQDLQSLISNLLEQGLIEIS